MLLFVVYNINLSNVSFSSYTVFFLSPIPESPSLLEELEKYIINYKSAVQKHHTSIFYVIFRGNGIANVLKHN